MILTDFTTFLFALGMVMLAEMGDKTQLLAMCFATRYKAASVLAGVFIATLMNHAAAVAVGYFLNEVLRQYTTVIQIIASLSFIGFGLWTLRGDKVDKNCKRKTSAGPVITVAIAFFLAEMGDKTQLATVSLAAKFPNPVAVLFGTTAGMLIADGIGIILGVIMNKKIPERVLKWVSASIFGLFGIAGYIESGNKIMGIEILILTTGLIIIAAALGACTILKRNKTGNG